MINYTIIDSIQKHLTITTDAIVYIYLEILIKRRHKLKTYLSPIAMYSFLTNPSSIIPKHFCYRWKQDKRLKSFIKSFMVNRKSLIMFV